MSRATWTQPSDFVFIPGVSGVQRVISVDLTMRITTVLHANSRFFFCQLSVNRTRKIVPQLITFWKMVNFLL